MSMARGTTLAACWHGGVGGGLGTANANHQRRGVDSWTMAFAYALVNQSPRRHSPDVCLAGGGGGGIGD